MPKLPGQGRLYRTISSSNLIDETSSSSPVQQAHTEEIITAEYIDIINEALAQTITNMHTRAEDANAKKLLATLRAIREKLGSLLTITPPPTPHIGSPRNSIVTTHSPAEEGMEETPGPPRLNQSLYEPIPEITTPDDLATLEASIHKWFTLDPKHHFTSRSLKERVASAIAAQKPPAALPPYQTRSIIYNEFESTDSLAIQNKKAREAVNAAANTSRTFFGPNTGDVEPVAPYMVAEASTQFIEKFKSGFTDAQLHDPIAALLQQPIHLIDKYIADVRKAAATIQKIHNAGISGDSAFLNSENNILIRQYFTIIENLNPADAKEISKLPKDILQEYNNLPIKDNLTIMQWVTKKLSNELARLDYIRPTLYNNIHTTFDTLLEANHKLTILLRSEIHHRNNLKTFSHEAQKTVESQKSLERLLNNLRSLQDRINQEFLHSTLADFQKILAPFNHKCTLGPLSFNPLLHTYEKVEILCQYIKNYYMDYAQDGGYFTHPGQEDQRRELTRLFYLADSFHSGTLYVDYQRTLDYYLEQKSYFDTVSEKTAPTTPTTPKSTNSSTSTTSSANIPKLNPLSEQAERAEKLNKYQESTLDPYAETLKNLGSSLPDYQINRILKTAFFRLFLQLSKALKQDDVEAKFTIQSAILELRVYKNWFDTLPLPSSEKDKLLNEALNFFNESAKKTQEGKTTNKTTLLKIGSAFAFAGFAGFCFAYSGEFSLDNPDFALPEALDDFAAYFGAFGSNFLNYFNSIQIIFELYADNMSELFWRTRHKGFLISPDFRVVPITPWQKIGDISQILGYAIGSTLLICFSMVGIFGDAGWGFVIFGALSVLLVSRFAIDSRCNNLNQKMLDKVFSNQDSLGWKIWWGFLFGVTGTISGAMGYATLGKFIAAFSDYVTISLIGANPLLFVSMIFFSIGYSILFASNIPAWLRISLGILFLGAALGILGFLAVTLGPEIFLLAAASFVAITTTMMVFKMLSNAFINLKENMTELWKLLKHTREENPNMSAGLIMFAFVLCTVAVGLNAVVFGALSILGLQDTLPMIVQPSAFFQPLWYLVTGFSALNGFNSSLGVQRRFVSHFGARLAIFCEYILPEYNKMLTREYAKDNGLRTTTAVWLVGAPLFIVAASLLLVEGLVYLACAKIQQLRHKDVSSVMSPLQILDMTMTHIMQPLLKLLNSVGQDNKPKAAKTDTTASPTDSVYASSPSSTSASSAPGCFSPITRMFSKMRSGSTSSSSTSSVKEHLLPPTPRSQLSPTPSLA